MTKGTKAKAAAVRNGTIVTVVPHTESRKRNKPEGEVKAQKLCVCNPRQTTHQVPADCTIASSQATIGQALLGKRVGQIARARKLNGDLVTYKILSIEAAPALEVQAQAA